MGHPPRSLVLEMAPSQQTARKRLPHCHLELLRLEIFRCVDNRPRWSRHGDAITPDGRDRAIFVRRVYDDAGRSAQPSIPAWHEYVHGVGNVVAEFVQDECTLMGNDGLFRTDGEPSLADVVMLAGRETTDAVKTAADALEPAGADMEREGELDA